MRSGDRTTGASMSFMTEATATLDYETYDYSRSSGTDYSKTVDLIGEEFIKKESGGAQSQAGGLIQLAQTASAMQKTMVSSTLAYSVSGQTSLPPLTYTTTTIPTISTQAASGEENGVLYCNLDDLSRYIPDNFNFDSMESMEGEGDLSSELSRVQVLSLPQHQQHLTSKPINISMGGAGAQYQIQVSSIVNPLDL